MTILKLKSSHESNQGKGAEAKAAWTTATEGIRSKRTACSVDYALSSLMTCSCVPIGAPSTRRTLTIHRQIEITFPDGGHLL